MKYERVLEKIISHVHEFWLLVISAYNLVLGWDSGTLTNGALKVGSYKIDFNSDILGVL